MRFSMMPLTTLSWLHQYYRSTLLGAVLTVGIARRIEEDGDRASPCQATATSPSYTAGHARRGAQSCCGAPARLQVVRKLLRSWAGYMWILVALQRSGARIARGSRPEPWQSMPGQPPNQGCRNSTEQKHARALIINKPKTAFLCNAEKQSTTCRDVSRSRG